MSSHRQKKFLRIRYEGARTLPRLTAAFVDFCFVLFSAGVIAYLAGPFITSFLPKDYRALDKALLFLCFSLLFHNFLYAPIIETRGKTPGKSLMAIKIMNNDDRVSPSIGQNFLRAMLRFVFYVPFIAGAIVQSRLYLAGGILFMMVPFLWHLFDRERQTLYDIWSGVIVLEKISEPTLRSSEEMRKSETPSMWEITEFPEHHKEVKAEVSRANETEQPS